jgi:2,4-dienoyl-CoA reductase-like NADH-dependent reductase (Old Yellow Enzyme family)
MALMFEPITLKGVTARNRIVVSPMCQYKSVDGSPTDWQLVNLGRYAIGGAGIIFYEETAVEDRGRKTPNCAGLWHDGQTPLYKRIADFAKEYGAVPAMQLGHSGGRGSELGPLHERKALADIGSGEAWQAISCSAVPIREGHPVPRAMSTNDIADVIEAFAQATRRSLEAGFEIMEIHGAHGYLIHQFLSPLINQRNDAYGGDRKGRMRFAIEVTEAVRAVWPEDKPLWFRVSCVDGQGGIWNMDDTVALAHELKHAGVDLIDCSSGGLSGKTDMPLVPRVPGYHLPYARRIKDEVGLMTMAPGMITDPEHAEATLRDGTVDVVGIARELMYNGDWPVHAAKLLGVAEHLDMFPPEFTHRLKLREQQRQMEINQVR